MDCPEFDDQVAQILDVSAQALGVELVSERFELKESTLFFNRTYKFKGFVREFKIKVCDIREIAPILDMEADKLSSWKGIPWSK